MERQQHNERGDTLITVAISLVMLLAMLALAIDVGVNYAERRRMQNAADAAALAGAAVMMQGGSDSEILAVVNEYATVHNLAQAFEAEYLPTEQSVGGGFVPANSTGVRVITEIDVPSFIAGIVGHPTLHAEALADGGFGPLDIVMVLDRSGSMDDDSCDLRENQCPSSDPHDVSSCAQCRGNWVGGHCDIDPGQLWPGHICNLSTQAGCQNCRGVWRSPPTPITQVRAAAITFVDRNNPNLSHLAVVSYSSNASLNQGLTANLTAVRNAINGIGTPYPSGCTNAADGITRGWQELMGPRMREDAARFIVFLTDGLPNYPQCASCPSNPGGCPAAMNAAIAEATNAANRGIVIYTIGLGNHVDHAFLTDIADITGGEYFHAPDPSDLEGIYQTIFERIQLRIVQ